MKTMLLLLCVLCIANLCVNPSHAAAADTNPPPRLTVELRDGSRVVGSSVEINFKFNSALLGEIELDVCAIRSVDCVSSNSAKLTTTGGDSLTVSFAEPEFAVNTSFGKVQLAVDSVRKLTVAAPGGTGTHPPGLVALWSGEGDGRDSVGGHDAQLMDVDFADGKVGRAFALNGSSSWMKIPASPALDVGKGDGFTITVWIKPSNIVSFRPILEWNNVTQCGVHLWLGHLPQQRGELFGNIVDDEGNAHALHSEQGVIVPGQFQHLALTYDKASGLARMFVNGRVVAQQNFGGFTPQTSYDLLISRRPGDHPGDWTYNAFYAGLLDEIALYNRALSSSEIEVLCQSENNGELPPAPPSGFNPPFNGIYRNGFRNGLSE